MAKRVTRAQPLPKKRGPYKKHKRPMYENAAAKQAAYRARVNEKKRYAERMQDALKTAAWTAYVYRKKLTVDFHGVRNAKDKYGIDSLEVACDRLFKANPWLAPKWWVAQHRLELK